ncbi:MAG: YdbH domain-containing protein [Myxococcota bacterium]|nr:YdbH domain-containing protein [Myxococcota bacterium]
MLLGILAVGLVSAGAGVAFLVKERRPLAERALAAVLRAQGFPDARVHVRQLGLSGAELSDLDPDGRGAATLDHLAVRWTPSGIRQGRVEELEATGLTLRISLDDQGAVSLGDGGPGASRPAALPTPARQVPARELPIGRGSIEDLEVALDTPVGPARFSGRVELSGTSARLEGRLRAAVLDLGAAGEVSVPALEVEGRGELREDGLHFEASVADAPRCLELRAVGRHDLATGAGEASVTLDRAQLGRGALEAPKLVPAAQPLLRAATGRIEGGGTVHWGGDETGSAVRVAVRDMDLDTTLARFEEIDTELEIDGPPWPPPIRRGQRITMKLFDFGLVLTDGQVSYGVLPNGAIEIERAEWRFAGGRVRTAGALDLRAEEQALLLLIEDVDLARLLELVNLTGLEGEGTVSGRLPLFRRKGRLEIRGGVLSTDAQGWVRYRAGPEVGAVTSQQTGFAEALRALRDFRYESLEVSLDGDPQGVVQIGLKLRGQNPTYFAGHPVDFNLNLEAPISAAFRSARLGSELPESIARQLVPGSEPGRPEPETVDCTPPAG